METVNLNFWIVGFPDDLIAAIIHRNYRVFGLTSIQFAELQVFFQEPCCYREPSWKVWPQDMYPFYSCKRWKCRHLLINNLLATESR